MRSKPVAAGLPMAARVAPTEDKSEALAGGTNPKRSPGLDAAAALAGGSAATAAAPKDEDATPAGSAKPNSTSNVHHAADVAPPLAVAQQPATAGPMPGWGRSAEGPATARVRDLGPEGFASVHRLDGHSPLKAEERAPAAAVPPAGGPPVASAEASASGGQGRSSAAAGIAPPPGGLEVGCAKDLGSDGQGFRPKGAAPGAGPGSLAPVTSAAQGGVPDQAPLLCQDQASAAAAAGERSSVSLPRTTSANGAALALTEANARPKAAAAQVLSAADKGLESLNGAAEIGRQAPQRLQNGRFRHQPSARAAEKDASNQTLDRIPAPGTSAQAACRGTEAPAPARANGNTASAGASAASPKPGPPDRLVIGAAKGMAVPPEHLPGPDGASGERPASPQPPGTLRPEGLHTDGSGSPEPLPEGRPLMPRPALLYGFLASPGHGAAVNAASIPECVGTAAGEPPLGSQPALSPAPHALPNGGAADALPSTATPTAVAPATGGSPLCSDVNSGAGPCSAGGTAPVAGAAAGELRQGAAGSGSVTPRQARAGATTQGVAAAAAVSLPVDEQRQGAAGGCAAAPDQAGSSGRGPRNLAPAAAMQAAPGYAQGAMESPASPHGQVQKKRRGCPPKRPRIDPAAASPHPGLSRRGEGSSPADALRGDALTAAALAGSGGSGRGGGNALAVGGPPGAGTGGRAADAAAAIGGPQGERFVGGAETGLLGLSAPGGTEGVGGAGAGNTGRLATPMAAESKGLGMAGDDDGAGPESAPPAGRSRSGRRTAAGRAGRTAGERGSGRGGGGGGGTALLLRRADRTQGLCQRRQSPLLLQDHPEQDAYLSYLIPGLCATCHASIKHKNLIA